MRSTHTPVRAAKRYQRKPVILAALLVGGIFGYEAASYRYAVQAALLAQGDIAHSLSKKLFQKHKKSFWYKPTLLLPFLLRTH